MRHHLLQKKGTLELLPLLFAVIAVSVDLVSTAGAMDLGELDANFRCVSGKLDGIQQEGQGGQQDVTVDDGQMMIKHRGTPKATFRAMVRDSRLVYELVADYGQRRETKCMDAIEELVGAEGCRLVEDWQRGECAGGKCTGGRLRVECDLSEVKQVQDDRGPTGYFVASVAVWSSEECLAVSAKFTNTDTNFCYLVPQTKGPEGHLVETMTVLQFMGRTITSSATEATTPTSTAVKTTTEKTKETTERSSTKTATWNTTAAETTIATTKGATETATQDMTAVTTNTADGTPTGPATTKDSGFAHPWLYWAVPTVVVLLGALAASAYVCWRRAKQQKEDVEAGANRQKEDVEAHLGSVPAQPGSAKSEGKTTKTETSKALKKAVVVEEYDELEGVKKEDTKDDGHEQVKSGPSHHLTSASAKKSEESGEKKEDETTVKAPPQKGISVPSSSSISEAAEKKKGKSTNSNGYEKVGSTLLADAGIEKKEEAKDGEYEVLPTL